MKGNEVANAVADCVAGNANSRMLLLDEEIRSYAHLHSCVHYYETHLSLKPNVPLI